MANIHGGNLRLANERFGRREYLDFSANINPLGVPEAFRAVWYDLIAGEALAQYPDIDCTRLREAIGRLIDIEPGSIVCGNGASELLHIAIAAKQPENVLLMEPCFAGYALAALANHARITRLITNAECQFEWDIDDLDLRDVDLLILGNPNNPTSRGMTKAKLDALLQVCHDENVDVILDEAFIDLMYSGHSAIECTVKNEHVLVIRAWTKSLAIPGVRLGYAVGARSWIDAMKMHQVEWSVNAFAQAIAVALPGLMDYQHNTQAWLAQEIPEYTKQIQALPHITGYVPQSNFMLWRFNGEHPQRLMEDMAQEGVLIRHCQNFYGLDERYFRTAIRSREENKRLFAALRRCVE